MKKAIIILFATLLAFSIISCDNNLPDTIEVASVTITGITESQEVEKGDTVQLSATVLPEDATDKGITWVSSDDKIATVSKTGLITGVAEGKVTISAIASNGVKDEVSITITPEIFTVSFDANLPDGVTAEVENMPDAITGIVSGSKVEEPETEPTLEGYVFFGWYQEGASDVFDFSTEIKEDMTLYANWKEVVVTGVTITGITEPLEVEKGETLQLSAIVQPENAIDKSITWVSSDDKIATVSETGLITGVAEGDVTISAIATNGVKDEVSITITPEIFTVSFDANLPDGVTAKVDNMPDAITGIVSGGKIEEPETEPILEGYVFSGWYQEGASDVFDFDTEIVEDVTLYAKWKEEVATPIISSERGDSYPKTIVSITVDTNEAEIYYTIDGVDPTVESTKYTEPFEVSGTVTVKAFATKDGVVSEIASSEIVPTGFIKVVSPDSVEEGYVFPLSVTLEYEGDGEAEIKYGFNDDKTTYVTYSESLEITEDKLSDDGTVTLYAVADVNGKEVASDTFFFKQKESSINAEIKLIQDTSTTGIFVISADNVGNGIQYRLDGGEWKDYENYAVANIAEGNSVTIEVREKGYRPSEKKTVSYGIPDPVDFDASLFPVITESASLPDQYVNYVIAPFGAFVSDTTESGDTPLIAEAMASLIGSEGTALGGIIKYELRDNDYTQMKITFLQDTDMFSGDLGVSGYPELGTATINGMFLKDSYIDLWNGDVRILLALGKEDGTYDKENYYIISLGEEGVLIVTDKDGTQVESDNPIYTIAQSSIMISPMIQSVIVLEKLTESLGKVISIDNTKIRFDEFGIEGEDINLTFSLSFDSREINFEGITGMTVFSDGISFSAPFSTEEGSMNITINGTCLVDNHSLVYSGVKISGGEFGVAMTEGTLWFDGKAYDSCDLSFLLF